MVTKKGDIELSFHRFLQDTKDDFFPDPLNYKDLTHKQNELVSDIKNKLDRVLSAKEVVYSRKQYLEGDTPKSHHVVRHTIILHPIDRIVYSYIVTHLAPFIELNLSKARYSHHLSSKQSKAIFGSRPIEHWLKFREAVKESINSNPSYKYIVSTDIAGYFEYIHIHDFKKQTAELSSRKNTKTNKIIELLSSFLKCFSPCQHSSIPQGYDASSYLASAFLDFLDKDLESEGLIHFRYVDDIKVVCMSESAAKKAIISIIKSLRKSNLNLSTIKTEIWNKNGNQFKKFIKDFPPILDKADKAVSSKRKTLIDSVLPKLNNDAKALIKGRKKEFDERLFRAYIWRIVKCHWYGNIKKVDLDCVAKSCIKLLYEMPGRTDSIVRFLILHKDRKYLQDALEEIIRTSVYSWQKMHLWRLLIQSNKIKNSNLLLLARNFIRDKSRSESSRNHALIFLGKHGDYNDRRFIASLFNETTSLFCKRAILIAIQEYTDKNTIYNSVLSSSSNELAIKSVVEYLRNISQPEYLDFNNRIGDSEAFIS